MDDQPLEGGGRGSGGATPRVSGKLAGATAATMAAPMLALPLASEYMEAKTKDKREREAADEVKRESRGKGLSDKEQQMVQEVDDAKMQTKKDKAYKAAETYPKNFSKGGTASARADGIAQRGKTKGTFVMCGGGMAKGKR
jgi:hypothetical protein